MGDLDELRTRRVPRGISEPVDEAMVARWCAEFGAQWPECVGDVVPALSFPTFVRPLSPGVEGASASTGVVLHDELKRMLDLPVAIAVGYELELHGELRLGERLESTEALASLGEPRSTRFGEGRDWVIEVATTTTDGSPVGVERFRMLGYRPSDGGASLRTSPVDAVAPMWTQSFDVDARAIVRMATANCVWAPAHHLLDAARAAGLPDIILDTSSQVALLAGAAHRRRPAVRITSVDLTMKRPILPGAFVTIGGTEQDDRTIVTAHVDGREVSRAVVVFAA